MEQLQRYLNHTKIDVVFKQNKDDFVVTEIPLYEFSGEGEHLVLKIRKKDLATWDAIEILAKYFAETGKSDVVEINNKDVIINKDFSAIDLDNQKKITDNIDLNRNIPFFNFLK